MLPNVKNSHYDVKGMGYHIYRDPHFDKVFEKHEGIELVHVVRVGNHADKFVTQDEGNDHPRNGNDHGIGEVLYHGEYAAIPGLRRLSNLSCDLTSFLIDVGEHVGQVRRNHAGEELTHPSFYLFKQSVKHVSAPPF